MDAEAADHEEERDPEIAEPKHEAEPGPWLATEVRHARVGGDGGVAHDDRERRHTPQLVDPLQASAAVHGQMVSTTVGRSTTIVYGLFPAAHPGEGLRRSLERGHHVLS